MPAYRVALANGGLDSRRAVRRLKSVDDALARLPRIDLEAFRTASSDHCIARVTERPRILSGSVATLRQSSKPAVLDSVVVRTGLTDPPLNDSDRDLLWRKFEVPVFEHLLGFDGNTLARECEIHEGLHVVPQNAILERVEGELVVTSLTGLDYPALRVRTGLTADWESAHCECGQTEPRLLNLLLKRSPASLTALETEFPAETPCSNRTFPWSGSLAAQIADPRAPAAR